MSKNVAISKPLKGYSFAANAAFLTNVTISNLNIPTDSVENLINGTNFTGVTILDSVINNTIIGTNSPNVAYFSDLHVFHDVTFLSLDHTKSVYWNASTGTLVLTGDFEVSGCALLGNLDICQNTIRAVNLNGDINLIPDNLGTLYFRGPINNQVSSTGNFYSNLADGNVTMIASDYINLVSNKSYIELSSFDKQTLTTVNGDISLNTDTGISNKTISTIFSNSAGNILVTGNESTNLKVGDQVLITGSSSIPNLNGVFRVKTIESDNSFTLSTSNVLISGSTSGSFTKLGSNNINLNATNLVTIPSDVELIFGSTSGSSPNTISGNTSGMFISASGNVIFTNPDTTSTSGKYLVEIPQYTQLRFGTSGSNGITFNGSQMIFNSNDQTVVTGNKTDINTYTTSFVDPILKIGNYTSATAPNSILTKDKGLEYYYTDSSGATKLGWFGFKQSTGEFTFIPDATDVDNIVSGAPGKFNISDISVTNLTMNENGIFEMSCGTIKNVNLITGCGGTVNINASSNVNITTANRIALISGGDIYIPNKTPITFGTAGTSIYESTNGNLHQTASKNIFLTTNSNGSVVLRMGTKMSFDGTTAGSNFVVSGTDGNMQIGTNRNILLNITSGNLILPANNSVTNFSQSSIQFGGISAGGTGAGSTETISGNTAGITVLTTSYSGSLNFVAASTASIVSSSGSVVLNAISGDIDLFTTSTSGSVRILPLNRLVFGTSGTANSLRADSNGNLVMNGAGVSNSIDLKNASNINLIASGGNVNIPTNVKLNLGTAAGLGGTSTGTFIVSDTSSNLNITNLSTSGNLNLKSTLDTNIETLNSTNISTGNLNVNSNSAVLNSGSVAINGNVTNLNSQNVKITDPILTIGNYIPAIGDPTDRGIEYYYKTTSGSTKMGWFGYKTSTGVFSFYSDAINTNETITGTLGQFQMSTALITNGITTGSINMTCGTISNLNTILGCGGLLNVRSDLNVSSSNIALSATQKVLIPYNIPLSFGDTTNTIWSDSNGNMTITSLGGSGKLILNSNVQINGTTENIYSTITNIQDPVISIGGVSGPQVNDNMDRGINFKWFSQTAGSVSGFFGFKNASNRFVFIPQTSSTSDNIYSGNYGDLQFSKAYLDNLDVNCGTISNVNTLMGCANNVLNVVANSSMNISSSNLALPYDSKLTFGTTSNSISANTSGNFNITAASGGINLITNTSGSGFVNISNNTPLRFGTSSSLIQTTSGSFNILNTVGNINLTPGNNVAGTYGSVNIPTYNSIVFSGTDASNRISSDGTQLDLFGYNNIGINSSTVTISGNVNIIGVINANSISSDTNAYILPLGTSSVLNIVNITQPTFGKLEVTTDVPNGLVVGDTVSLKYTDTVPIVDGVYTVSSVISPTRFRVNIGSTLTKNGTTGKTVSMLVTYQGKDVGIEVFRWSSTVGNTQISTGSAGFHSGFFGWKDSSQNFVFYSDATVSNNVVTNGTLADVQLNELYANRIGGYILDGAISGGNNAIMGNNFQISGGSINSTPIGSVGASTGRFTNLSSTISASLYGVSLQSTLNYSVERYSLSSLLGNSRNPSLATVTSFVSVVGASFNTYGTMGNAGVTDGQIKKVVMSSINAGCTYTLFFGSGKLITPNPMGGASPTRITFKRQGQSCEIIYDLTSAAWILLNGNGYVS
jgi:hypothetical protein